MLTNMEQASRENAFYYKVHQQGCVDQHGAGFHSAQPFGPCSGD